MTTLFDDGTLGDISIQNRVFMAPLTRNRAQSDGVAKDITVKYYAQRASAGLIITEATQISALGKGYIDTPGIYNDAHVAAWKKVTSAVHQNNGKIFSQIWHVGRISHTSLLPDGQAPVAPSAIQANSKTFTAQGLTDVSMPRALETEEVKALVQDYRHAAQCAKDAGFDGVEVHSANGYLLDQFLRNGTNTRTDEYGGSPENRIRLLLEVVAAAADVFGAGRVGVRLSPTGEFNDMSDSDPRATFGLAVEKLNEMGLAYLHMVEKMFGEEPSEDKTSIIKDVRSKWTGFYIANGDYDLAEAQAALQDGHAHAVAFGRPFIANPDLPARFAQGAPLNAPDQATFYGGGEEGYTDYPFLNQAAA